MNIIIGLLLMVYSIGYSSYLYLNGGIDLSDTRTVLQLVVSGIGSFVILAPVVWRKLTQIKLPNFPKPKEKDVKILDCDEKIKMDYECLHYLKHRSIEMGSDEALNLIIELNNLLFSDSCKKEKK